MTKKTRMSRAKFAREVLERDHYTSVISGKTIAETVIDPHHLTGRVSILDDVRAAGVSVTRAEHRAITDGKLKLKASQLPDECIEFIIMRKWEGWDGIIWDRK